MRVRAIPVPYVRDRQYMQSYGFYESKKIWTCRLITIDNYGALYNIEICIVQPHIKLKFTKPNTVPWILRLAAGCCCRQAAAPPSTKQQIQKYRLNTVSWSQKLTTLTILCTCECDNSFLSCQTSILQNTAQAGQRTSLLLTASR